MSYDPAKSPIGQGKARSAKYDPIVVDKLFLSNISIALGRAFVSVIYKQVAWVKFHGGLRLARKFTLDRRAVLCR